MKSVFNLNITDIPIENKFITKLEASGFSKFFPPQALGALTMFDFPITDEIIELDKNIYSEFGIPFFKLFQEKVEHVNPDNPPISDDLKRGIKLRENFLFCIPNSLRMTK